MHELSLCEEMVALIEKQAANELFERVKCVRLEVGLLSCVEPYAMHFAFNAASKGSVAEHATLIMDEVTGKGWCDVCAKEVDMQQRYDACPACGATGLSILRGEELRIVEMEVI